MVDWTRSTPWRQASILDQEMLGVLREILPSMPGAAEIAVIVSHDCDLAADPSIEPTAEVVPAALVWEENGALTHAKDARRLHLTVTEPDTGQKHFCELKATDRFQVSKGRLAGIAPSNKYSLDRNQLEILRRWLAARYRRHAFPDAFEARFNKVEEKLREILKKSSNHLRAILFDLDESADIAREGADAPYGLDIYLVYTSAAPAESLKVAEETKAKIESDLAPAKRTP